MTTRDKLAGTFFEARAAASGAIGRLDSMLWTLRITCLASLGVSGARAEDAAPAENAKAAGPLGRDFTSL
jgi:hypothetical protein